MGAFYGELEGNGLPELGLLLFPQLQPPSVLPLLGSTLWLNFLCSWETMLLLVIVIKPVSTRVTVERSGSPPKDNWVFTDCQSCRVAGCVVRSPMTPWPFRAFSSQYKSKGSMVATPLCSKPTCPGAAGVALVRRFSREQKPPEGGLGPSFPPQTPPGAAQEGGRTCFLPSGEQRDSITPRQASACLPVGEKSAGVFKGRKRRN